jgi:hypothetical protein
LIPHLSTSSPEPGPTWRAILRNDGGPQYITQETNQISNVIAEAFLLGNFIVAAPSLFTLPPTAAGHDMILTVTCRFSKRILLIKGQTTWTAAKWTVAWLTALRRADWSIPSVLIGDRDPL